MSGAGDCHSHGSDGANHSHTSPTGDGSGGDADSPIPKVEPPTEKMDITIATQYGRINRVKELIANNDVDVNAPDKEGCYLLHWAAINNRVDLIKFYLSMGAVVDQIGGDLMASPLHWATRSGHLESVVVLTRHGADPLVKDKEGLNCIMVATAFEHTHCLAYMLAKLGSSRHPGNGYSFDINATDKEGRTAALWASCRNHDVDPLRLLLSHGANLDVHDSKKRSPLHWSAFIGSAASMDIIMKTNQCDPTCRDVDGHTALDYAEKSNQHAMYRSMRTYDWHFRRRIGQSHATGLFNGVWEGVKHNENFHKKFVAILPAFFYAYIGFLLEQSMSYWLKAALIFGLFYPVFVFIRFYASSPAVMNTLPVFVSIGTKFWLYCSYFALSYSLRTTPLYVDVVFWFIVPTGIVFFYKAMMTEPGIITANKDKDVFNKEIIERVETAVDSGTTYKLEDFCFTCLVRRPLRSKHCASCDQCVARFDHHCPWIANCVALNNLKFFLGYLLFLSISLCWDMHGNVIYAMSKCEVPLSWDGGFWSALGICSALSTASPWAAWNYCNAALYGIGVIILFICQLYQACANITTNERMRHFRYKHFRDEKNKYRNPFSRGCLQNFADSLNIGIPKLLQPSPIDWKRCYSIKDVEFHYLGHASPSKMA